MIQTRLADNQVMYGEPDPYSNVATLGVPGDPASIHPWFNPFYTGQTRPVSLEQQKLNLLQHITGKMFGPGGFGGPSGGAGGSFLNLFDLARQRAQQGLSDQFTQAGGATALPGAFSTASANLEKGLGQTEQGSLVDLYSRMYQPQLGFLASLLGTIGK